MDMVDLEAQLVATQACRNRLIVSDGVFSMDGDVAPLKDICDLADKYVREAHFVSVKKRSVVSQVDVCFCVSRFNALVFIDECHATGFFGRTGRGTPEYCNVMGRVDVSLVGLRS
jgi:glycine C-acetyltransferase